MAIISKQATKCNTTTFYINKLGLAENEINLRKIDLICRKANKPENIKSFTLNFVRYELKFSVKSSHYTDVEKYCLLCFKVGNIIIPETGYHVFFTCNSHRLIFSYVIGYYFAGNMN